MSLTTTSGRTAAIDCSADSPLCAKATPKPSWLNTSHSNSHVTRSSSTTVMRGLDLMCDLRPRHPQNEPRAGGRVPSLDGASLLRENLAGDREAQAAAVRLARPQRLEEMVDRIRRQPGAAVLQRQLD